MADLRNTASDRRDTRVASIETEQSNSPPDKVALIHAICMVLFIAGSIIAGWLMSPGFPDKPTPVSADLSEAAELSASPQSAVP